MTTDHTTRTLGSLISDPDTVVQRHAHGIIKQLRARECPEHPAGACYLSCPFRPNADKVGSAQLHCRACGKPAVLCKYPKEHQGIGAYI